MAAFAKIGAQKFVEYVDDRKKRDIEKPLYLADKKKSLQDCLPDI